MINYFCKLYKIVDIINLICSDSLGSFCSQLDGSMDEIKEQLTTVNRTDYNIQPASASSSCRRLLFFLFPCI